MIYGTIFKATKSVFQSYVVRLQESYLVFFFVCVFSPSPTSFTDDGFAGQSCKIRRPKAHAKGSMLIPKNKVVVALDSRYDLHWKVRPTMGF